MGPALTNEKSYKTNTTGPQEAREPEVIPRFSCLTQSRITGRSVGSEVQGFELLIHSRQGSRRDTNTAKGTNPAPFMRGREEQWQVRESPLPLSPFTLRTPWNQDFPTGLFTLAVISEVETTYIRIAPLFFYLLFWPYCVACRILVPRPGTEPRPMAVKAPSPNHWTAREIPRNCSFK